MKERANKQAPSSKKKIKGFQVVEDKCIWMKGGVVNFRLCDNVYDCNSCPFDKAMRKAMNLESPAKAKKEVPDWVQSLRKKYHGASRPCRHVLTGHIDAPKICVMDYECYHCAYDQLLYEEDLARPIGKPGYKIVSGFKMAEDYYYHMGHSWARFEHGGLVRVGLDDFMVKLFGAVEEITLPPLGATLKQNEVGWTFGRNGNKAAVLSPVSGTLLTTNHKVLEQAEITNHDPYHSGWLFILEPDLPKRNLRRLYFGKESFQWIEQESQKLMGLIGPQYEQMAATGGEIINDLFGNIPNLGWNRLVNTFLHTEKI